MGSDPTNKGFILELENDGKELAVLVTDGQARPDEEWGLTVLVDGEEVARFPDLSSDPASPRYFLDVVNQADGNDFVRLEDLRTGASTPEARPASFGGTVVSVAGSTLMIRAWEAVPGTGNAGNGTVNQVTLRSESREDTITLTVTNATTPGSETWSVQSQLPGAVANATTGQLHAAANDCGVEFRLQAGGRPFAVGDTITLHVRPLPWDGLAGGTLYPDQNDRSRRFRIAWSSRESITWPGRGPEGATSRPGGAWPRPGARWRGGYAAVSDAHTRGHVAGSPLTFWPRAVTAWPLATPGFSRPRPRRIELAEARNWQFRLDIPPDVVTESGVEQSVDGAGRSEFAVVTFPSYATVTDPETGAKRVASLTGAIHGREALVARDYNGFHKAAAGIEVTLPVVLSLPTGRRPLDLERLNPRGINTVRSEWQAVLWGDRTLAVDPAWRFKHQRELMSHYENTCARPSSYRLAINDRAAEQQVLTALRSFFVPSSPSARARRPLRGRGPDQGR